SGAILAERGRSFVRPCCPSRPPYPQRYRGGGALVKALVSRFRAAGAQAGLGRQGDGEGGTAADVAGRADRAAVHLDEGPVQAQAARGPPASGGAGPRTAPCHWPPSAPGPPGPPRGGPAAARTGRPPAPWSSGRSGG